MWDLKPLNCGDLMNKEKGDSGNMERSTRNMSEPASARIDRGRNHSRVNNKCAICAWAMINAPMDKKIFPASVIFN